MGINYVPKNWNKLLRLNLNSGFNDITGEFTSPSVSSGVLGTEGTIKEDDLFLHFQVYPHPKIKYEDRYIKGQLPYEFSNSPIDSESYKFLHPNSDLHERIVHTYNSDNTTFASAMGRITDLINSVVSANVSAFNRGTKASVYDVPVMWSNTERREFTININLFVYDDIEKDVYEPIRWFRKHSYPTLNQAKDIKDSGKFIENAKSNIEQVSLASRLGIIDMPHVFRISGGAFKTLQSVSRYNYYNLVNINIDYNDKGKFFIQGFPMFATLQLTFQEAIKMYSDMFDGKQLDIIKINIKENEIIQPTKGDTRVADFEKPSTIFERFVSATGIAKLTRNLEERIKNEAIAFVLKTIQGSNLYKRFDDILNIDLRHRIELRNYTHAGFSRSSNIEQSHINEIGNVNNNKTPKRDSAIIEQEHLNDITQALRRVR